MKRGSIVGPLVLIAVGVLLLLRNLNPDWVNFESILRLWPFVLIVWGALRAVELGTWWARGKTLPAAGISGGEWTLVVLLTLFSSAALGIRDNFRGRWINFPGIHVFSEPREFDVNAEAETGATPRIVIESERGRVRVVGADTTKTRVTGKEIYRAVDVNEIEKIRKNSKVTIAPDADRFLVKVDLGQFDPDRMSAEADLEIQVPRGASVEFRGRTADFDASDINGAVIVDSDRSEIRTQNIGSLRAKIRKTDVIRAIGVKDTVEIEGRVDTLEVSDALGQVSVNGDVGDVQFRNLAKPVVYKSSRTEMRVASITGRVRMESGDLEATGLTGPVFLRTKSKDVNISDYSGAIELQLDRGTVDLRPAKGALGRTKVETSNGDVTLAIPEQATFNITGLAERGSVTNNYGAPLNSNCENRDCKLTGIVGANGPQVELRTRRGDVIVTRGIVLSNSDEDRESREERRRERREEGPRPPAPPEPPAGPSAAPRPPAKVF